MTITINGKIEAFDNAITLASLIHNKCPNPKCIIAEINENIIKRELWKSHTLNDGDKVELVTFVGGG